MSAFKIKCLNSESKKLVLRSLVVCDFYCYAYWRKGNILVFSLVTDYTLIFISESEIFCLSLSNVANDVFYLKHSRRQWVCVWCVDQKTNIMVIGAVCSFRTNEFWFWEGRIKEKNYDYCSENLVTRTLSCALNPYN